MDWKEVGKTIAQIGAPLLGNALLPGVGGAAATAIVSAALGTDNDAAAVAAAVKNDPDAALKLRQIEADHERELRQMALTARSAELEAETKRLGEINATMRAEYQSADKYVSRWRPTYGYAFTATWTALFGAVVFAIVRDPKSAVDVIAAVAQLTTLWGVGLAVLGVSIAKRSQDKAIQAGNPAAGFGIFQAVAQRIAGNGTK